MKSGLGAALFDMDGVLIDSASVAHGLLVSTAARHGVHLSTDELARLSGASGFQFWSYVKEAYALPKNVDEYQESYDAEAEVAAYDASLIAEGACELMAALDASGVRVGVVTSASRWRTGQVIDLLGITGLVSVVVCSEDVEAHKPDPAPYAVAAERLRLRPRDCLAVEDSSRGVRSAVAAGAAVVAYVGFGEDREAVRQSHGIVRDFGRESPASLAAAHRSAHGESVDTSAAATRRRLTPPSQLAPRKGRT